VGELMTVPPADPRANYLVHGAEIDHAIQRVLESGSYILGREVQLFEQEFSQYLGQGLHAVGVASGTDAIMLALKVLGVGSGDVVFTVSLTAVATVAAVEAAGAIPFPVDVHPQTYTMDPERLNEAIQYVSKHRRIVNGRPAAVLPVHLYGHPADMKAINEIAGTHGLHVIEDCAQAHGADLEGTKAGCWADIAAFSFYPTKNLGALGDGGAVVTRNPQLADKLRLLRQYGWRDRSASEIPGHNSRLDELQAAILRVKLNYLDEDNERRRSVAASYSEAFAATDLILPRSASRVNHVYHQYVIATPHRDEFRTSLGAQGIGTAIHYPVPVHVQPAYAGRILPEGHSLPITEQLCARIVSLPMFPELTQEQVSRVCAAVLAWTRQRTRTR
jgi:dTDP-4-amino-4,6-dideoxygalactose transaminase